MPAQLSTGFLSACQPCQQAPQPCMQCPVCCFCLLLCSPLIIWLTMVWKAQQEVRVTGLASTHTFLNSYSETFVGSSGFQSFYDRNSYGSAVYNIYVMFANNPQIFINHHVTTKSDFLVKTCQLFLSDILFHIFYSHPDGVI